MRTLALLFLGIMLLSGCDNKYAVPSTIPIPEGIGPKGAPNVGIPGPGASKEKSNPNETTEKP